MSARGVRIVVGEGPSTRRGLLRFVLDGEGFDVVADAGTTAELARLMAIHRPDVVVLDDGIGATAVSMINEMSPNTKVVLVWPGAVMPVGGAARVEPSRVLQDLGPAITRLTGQTGVAAGGRGAALLDRAANDPDMLRAMLLGGLSAVDDAIIEDREPAPVVILPLTPTIDHSELILNVPDAEPDDDERTGVGTAAGSSGLAAGASVLAGSGQAAAGQGATGIAAATPLTARRGALGSQSVLNRRLGNLALGGAAVASALVLALALGGARVPTDVVLGLGPSTTSSTPGESDTSPPTVTPEPGGENTIPGDPIDTGSANFPATSPSVALVGNVIPEPPGPPDVVVDPGDLGPGGGGNPPDGGDGGDDGGDDHTGGDSGDHDRGGGNDDPDNGGGGGDGGDDDGSDDHDSGGGNDDDGGDHDNGGGNDDEDNPAHDHGDGDDPGGDGSDGGDDGESDETDGGGDTGESGGGPDKNTEADDPGEDAGSGSEGGGTGNSENH
ncbi:MAG: hypothetical protein WEE66_02335 [Actinomycetota bacterium]